MLLYAAASAAAAAVCSKNITETITRVAEKIQILLLLLLYMLRNPPSWDDAIDTDQEASRLHDGDDHCILMREGQQDHRLIREVLLFTTVPGIYDVDRHEGT